MTTDSAKGPPSVELAQALQLPNLASVDKERQERKHKATTKARASYGRTTTRRTPKRESAHRSGKGQEKEGAKQERQAAD